MTIPDDGNTVAIAELALLQVPPKVPSLSVIELASQSLVMPVIAATGGFTVTTVVRAQPEVVL
jgi:hypothetical protein